MKGESRGDNSGIESRDFVHLDIGTLVTVNRVPGVVTGFSPTTWGCAILITVNGTIGEYHPIDIVNGIIQVVAEETAR